MTIDDLKYIFKYQLDNSEDNLYYMLIENETKLIERHPQNDLVGLLPLLDNFSFAGFSPQTMPRFQKL
jgi:hypothetical protein